MTNTFSNRILEKISDDFIFRQKQRPGFKKSKEDVVGALIDQGDIFVKRSINLNHNISKQSIEAIESLYGYIKLCSFTHQQEIHKLLNNQCSDFGTSEDMSQLLQTQFIGSDLSMIINIEKDYRKKNELSTTKKIIREEKYIDFIKSYGNVSDWQGMMLLFNDKSSLSSKVTEIKSALVNEPIEEIDLGVFGLKNTIKESLSNKFNPIYTISLGGGDASNIALGEIAFRLSTSSQCDLLLEILSSEGIIKDNKIVDHFYFRKGIFEKLINLNHPIYRMIQDINMFSIITDGSFEPNLEHIAPSIYESIKYLINKQGNNQLIDLCQRYITSDKNIILEVINSIIDEKYTSQRDKRI